MPANKLLESRFGAVVDAGAEKFLVRLIIHCLKYAAAMKTGQYEALRVLCKGKGDEEIEGEERLQLFKRSKTVDTPRWSV